MSAIRKVSIIVIVCIAIWFVVPTASSINIFGGKQVNVAIESKTSIEPQQGEEEDLDKIHTPVYFSIFKFITGFLPGRN